MINILHRSIKNRRLKFLLLFVCLSFMLSYPVPALAAQENFIISQYNVDIQANLDYSFIFTETITLDFSQDMRGILRAIPKKGGAQRYTISDISVKGDPFAIEQDPLNLIIRIGDANTTIRGNKTYTISYTLSFNKDNDPTQDLVNLDVIGTMWDTQIKNATINFYFPIKTVKPDTYQVFTGVYGSKDETGSSATLAADRLTIESNRQLSNFEGISLYVRFPDNTFSEAKDLPEPFQFSNYTADIDVRKDRIVHYKETFDLKINDQSQSVFYNLPLITQDFSPLVVRNVRLNGSKLLVNDLQGVFPILLSKDGTNQLEYTVYYKADDDPSKDTLSLMLFSNYREVTLPPPKITIVSNFKEPISYQTTVSILKADGTPDRVQNTQGKNLSIDIKSPLLTGEGIYIDLEYPQDSFGFVLALLTVILILGGILLLILSLFWYNKYGKDDVVSPVVEFYPPEGLSSGAVGYIGSRTVTPIDVSTMLLYWASHNHLHFLATGKKDFDISYISDLDEMHPQWEHNAFAKLKTLILEAGNSLSKDSLQTSFYKVSEKIKPAIPLFFKNEKALDDKKSLKMSGLLSFLSALWMGIVTAIITYTGSEVLLLSLIAGVVALALSSIFFRKARLLSNGWHERSKPKNFSLTFLYILFAVISVLFVLFAAFVFSTTVQLPAILFTILVVILTQIIAVFTIKRSVYGQQILERVVGFRDFIKVAEKERLEALLEDNPEYYYQVLPYALVLNVSDIWEDKFKGLQMVEPSWYQGGYPGYVFSYAMLTSFAYSTSTSLSQYTAPPSASGTGGFSGGGMGGGGGFSGGGGGGGGGSGW